MRNNKQSGPFSKEELLQLGFKPYDLIWVEGKSALWRYPSEVPELKEYAPAVEEQPYDRFYKRKTDEQKEQEPAAVSVKNGYVSVIMPKQAAPVKKEEPAFIPAPASVPVFTERPVEVETKYSQPLDEIKERYVKQLQQRKHKISKKIFIIQILKNAAVFVAIIGSGILIGFAIKPKHSTKNNAVNTPLQNVSSGTTEVSAKEVLMQANNNHSDATKINGTKQLPGNNNNEVADIRSGSHPVLITDNKSTKVEKNKVNKEKDESPINQSASPTTINTANGERLKKSRNSNTINESNEKPFDKLSIAATGDISTLVSVKANNYKLRDFGGFRNLELTVTNDSKFTLDNVLVELQYLNINRQPVKVEHIRFQSIEPGGLLTIRIPDNNRGAKLLFKIIKIEPKIS